MLVLNYNLKVGREYDIGVRMIKFKGVVEICIIVYGIDIFVLRRGLVW